MYYFIFGNMKMLLWKNNLHLLTPDEFELIPDGFELESILGDTVIKGQDYIDGDTRGGHLAYGIKDLKNHPKKDEIILFLLKK